MDKLYGLIQDINPKEICNHIENGNLAEWCNAWRIAAKEALQQKSNADRIRAMSDEEMAEFLYTEFLDEEGSKSRITEWLKQPAE